MGLFSTTTKTKATMTPDNPTWVTQPSEGIFGQLATAGARDPTSYIAPANDSLMMADQKAQGLGTDYNSLFGDAASGIKDLLAGGPAQASSGQFGDLSKYMNQYTGQVLDTGLQNLNREGDRALTNTRLAYAGPNYGSNASVNEALTQGELANNRSNFISNTLFGSADRAAGLADSQANRDQQTNLTNAQLSSTDNAQKLSALAGLGQLGGLFGDSQRADIGTLSNTGGTLQGIDQATAAAPITVPGDIASIIAQLGPLFQGQTTTGTSKSSGGLGNQLLSIGGSLGSAFLGGGKK